MTIKTYDILAISTALSPLTHNEGTEGNETLIQREAIMIDGHQAWVPRLTGNALRHRMVRAPGARWLVDRWGLRGKLSIPQLQMLFHGGALTRGSATESLSRVREFWRVFPLWRVVGGCLPDMIIGGTLYAWHGVLVCRENANRITAALPDGYELPANLLPAQRVIGRYQYVRNDARNTCADLADEEQDGAGGQMIYSGQAVNAGAVFAHGFRLRDATRIDLGALLLSLALYMRDVGTIGGMSSRGHGRLSTRFDVPDDADDCIAEYVDHADSVRDDAIAWFERELGAKAVSTGKAKRKKSAKKAAKKDTKAKDEALAVEAEGLF